jgi:hypothetical protein
MFLIGLVAMYSLLNAGNPQSLLRHLFPDPKDDVYIAAVSSVLVFILGFFVFFSRDREGFRQLIELKKRGGNSAFNSRGHGEPRGIQTQYGTEKTYCVSIRVYLVFSESAHGPIRKSAMDYNCRCVFRDHFLHFLVAMAGAEMD